MPIITFDSNLQPSYPDNAGFLTSISYNLNYQSWVDQLPISKALSLAITIDRGNITEFQNAYNAAKATVNPSVTAINEWQAIADQNYINVTF